MLKLVDITKDYVMSDETVHALKGVSVNFRRNEFVAILGPSGCGKTTLLNIVGGLDRYTDGDLIIEGKSTKNYKDNDWDTYRNHSIGFIFQSYNLINHINILKNVELALTISGIDKVERKQRAEKALEMVGLKGQGKKKPNQLSGGQCQRVAIARALINNPEIVLADEPTGALDSETSVQIMELLKEVAKDRLVIMVTHNPELANLYATRIIRAKDGEIIDDTNPFEGESVAEREKYVLKRNEKFQSKGKKKLTSMSFLTALALSGNNLWSKKTRSMLISFAGSIGIIGIALILSLSSGFNNYILDVQTNSMSSAPLTVNKSSYNAKMSDMMAAMMDKGGGTKFPEDEKVKENSVLTDLLTQMVTLEQNDTKAFKKYLEEEETNKKFKEVASDIQYSYSQPVNFYAPKDFDGNPISYVSKLSPIYENDTDNFFYKGKPYRTASGEKLSDEEQKAYDETFNGAAQFVSRQMNWLSNMGSTAFGPLIDNEPLLNEQFDVLKGHLPTNVNEVVIKLDIFNQISDVFLYQMGVKDVSYMMSQYIYSLIQLTDLGATLGMRKPADDPKFKASFEDMMGLEFSVMLNTQKYVKEMDPSKELGYSYKYINNEKDKILDIIHNTMKLKVVGIVRPKKGVTMDSFSSAIGYHPDLYHYLVNNSIEPSDPRFANSTILKDQMAHPEYDMLTGNKFPEGEKTIETQYNENLVDFGYVNYESPDSIKIFPKSFEDKEKIIELVNEYNQSVVSKQRITVIDSVGAMLTSMQTIVDSVSYVLIAFVSISLLVSSIMIGIITYVSVLERTKEIGILRSIGARKKDISRVFNAETLIIGLAAGLLGIAVASILNLPVMFIINALTDIGLTVIVPWYGAIILPAISVLLTIVAGLIPSSIAAKRDPVIALRME